MNNDLAQPIGLTLYQRDIDLLDRVRDECGLYTRSATVRYIIADWIRLKRSAIAAASGTCSAQGGCDCPADTETDD